MTTPSDEAFAGGAAASASASTLLAAHRLLDRGCSQVNRAFLECKARDMDPRACLAAGEAVFQCSEAVLRDARAKAGPELDEYALCLRRHAGKLPKCRVAEQDFAKACGLIQ